MSIRAVGAIACGFLTWYAVFMLLEAVGFWLWDLSPNNIPSEILVGFASSLLAIFAAEAVVAKIAPDFKERLALLSIGALVLASYVAVLLLVGEPRVGYAAVLVGLGASLVPFALALRHPNA